MNRQFLEMAQHFYQQTQDFTQAKLRLSTLMRKCTAIKYTLTEDEFSILESKHLTVPFTDPRSIIFHVTQKSNPNRKNYTFQLFVIKFPNLHIFWSAGKNLALPGTLSRNTPLKLITRNTTVEKTQKINKILSCKRLIIAMKAMQVCSQKQSRQNANK